MKKNDQVDFFVIFLNVFKCCHCQYIFSSNNRLYDHVRRKICLQQSFFVVLKKQFHIDKKSKNFLRNFRNRII